MAMASGCSTSSAHGSFTLSCGVHEVHNRSVCIAQVFKHRKNFETKGFFFTSCKTKVSKQWDALLFTTQKQSTQIRAISAEKKKETEKPIPPVPKSIHDISNGDHILGFGADLGEDHPGYHDSEYKKRRSYIADLAKLHKIGEPIPIVDYSTEETRVWGHVLDTLVDLYPTHACKEYNDCYKLFNFNANRVPQLEEVSQVLERSTGWRIRPVAGLLHPRDFLNGLAFRTFHSTQYLRHVSSPAYTPEPDLCHELLGHVPLLAHPDFADLASVIGHASLGASDKHVWHLTRLYWYTLEFGTLRGSAEANDDDVRAFGAGLLSSIGELRHMRSGIPQFVHLDPFQKMPKMSYKDGFQKQYFVCDSLSDAAAKLRAYSRSIHTKPHHQQPL